MFTKINKGIQGLFIITALLYLGLLPWIQYLVTSILKPIPILILIIAVLSAKASKPFKQVLVLALGFSLLGDIALTLPGLWMIQWGIALFMMAHCSYIVLFLKIYAFKRWRVISFLPVLIIMILFYTAIYPHLNEMAAPAAFYMIVLGMMVFFALQVRYEALTIVSGAMVFLFSDAVLSLNLFVYPESDHRILIMLSYYLAQYLLVGGLMKASSQVKQ